ncbi:MAG: DUF3953 domain-containing protein [Bacillaceae bacterium]|nr:DUF3953 domain-containing protein [Bacillaceae bacterium]
MYYWCDYSIGISDILKLNISKGCSKIGAALFILLISVSSTSSETPHFSS